MPSLTTRPPGQTPYKTPSQILAETEAQWLFTQEEIENSPSVRDGMPAHEEDALRKKSLNFITGVGIGLKLPQLTLYTAGIFLNRFFMRHSLVPQKGQTRPLHHYQIAAVALFLATKTEENCRKTKEIIIACCRVAQKKPELIIDEQSKDFWRWRDTLLLYEDVLLEALCFDLSIESPHKLLFELIKGLRVEHNKKLRTAAWSFVNDSALTTLGIRFSCRAIACAAVYCAARFCGLNPRAPREEPDEKSKSTPDATAAAAATPGESTPPVEDKQEQAAAWWEAHDVTLRDIKRACNFMADMYAGTKDGTDGEASIYVGLYSPLDDAAQDAREDLNNAVSQNPPSPGASQNTSQSQSQSQARERTPAAAAKGRAPSDADGVAARDEARGVKRDRDGTPRPQDAVAAINKLLGKTGDGTTTLTPEAEKLALPKTSASAAAADDETKRQKDHDDNDAGSEEGELEE